MKVISKARGFTLIELLIVIGIIAVLAGIVLVAVNPARQFAQANNTQRRADVNTLLNAVGQFQVDNRGQLPAGITTTVTNIGTGAGLVNLSTDLVPAYLADIPFDPLTGAPTDTGYEISVSATDGRVTVSAPDAELGETISVTR